MQLKDVLRRFSDVAMARLPQLNELSPVSILYTCPPPLSCLPPLPVQLKDVLRRFPDVAMACLPQLNELSPGSIIQPEARAALVWILGQFGEHIQVCGGVRACGCEEKRSAGTVVGEGSGGGGFWGSLGSTLRYVVGCAHV